VSGESKDGEHTTIVARAVPAGWALEHEEIGHYLVVMQGGEPGRRLRLGTEPRTVGRDSARDLVLVDSDVSRLHLRVAIHGDRVVVEDQHSTNGTCIDGRPIDGPTVLTEGSLLQIGRHVLRLERRSTRDVQRSEALARDLERASQYVRALLPRPLADGPIRTDWLFQPSEQLGGDALGHEQIDADHFAMYVLDVSGHGVSAAMHSVSVLNVLRQHALAANMRDPASVLSSLNATFQMDDHDGMYFTLWYGVYHVAERRLHYACAGHHPGFLVSAGKDTAIPLRTSGLMIGALPGVGYTAAQVAVPPGSSLYLFSDGVFEILTGEQRQWRLEDFVPLISEPCRNGVAESERLYRAVRSAARPGPLDDDFSLMVVTFS